MLFGKKKTKEQPRTMLERKLKSTILTTVPIFLVLFTLSTSLFSASGASIAMANYYPGDGETYEFIDHFLEQTTAVNTNTTVAVSIDEGPPIPMPYQGIKNEIASGDTVARDWYMWQITIPAITAPGKHTFQFFRHYYVWQEADKYWAEFDSYSTVQSFNITDSSATPSQSPPPATMNTSYIAVITASATAALLVLVTFTLRKRTQRSSRKLHTQ